MLTTIYTNREYKDFNGHVFEVERFFKSTNQLLIKNVKTNKLELLEKSSWEHLILLPITYCATVAFYRNNKRIEVYISDDRISKKEVAEDVDCQVRDIVKIEHVEYIDE